LENIKKELGLVGGRSYYLWINSKFGPLTLRFHHYWVGIEVFGPKGGNPFLKFFQEEVLTIFWPTSIHG